MVDEVVAADAVDEADTVDPAIASIEGRARRMGWRPKDEFRGDTSRWTDAQTFVERGETELPVLRERYRALDDRFAKLETNTQESARQAEARHKETKAAFDEFREFSSRGEERAYARAKAELEARMQSAVQTADTAQFTTAKAELDALDRARPNVTVKPAVNEAPVVVVPPVPVIHPDAQQWINDNAWFNADPVMTQYALAVHNGMLRDQPGLSMRDNLAETKADVMARFPEKFENPRRAAAAAVAATNTGTPTAKQKGKYPDYASWPADAKAAYTKFKGQMPTYTTEEYAKIYFGDEK